MNNQPTADRRSFLGGSALAAAAISIPAASLATGALTDWDIKKARYYALRAKYDAFIDSHYKSHLALWKKDHAQSIPAHIEAEADRLGDPADALEDDLMGMSAPHRAALRWKLDKALEINNGSTTGWPAEYMHQTIADYRLLLGDA